MNSTETSLNIPDASTQAVSKSQELTSLEICQKQAEIIEKAFTDSSISSSDSSISPRDSSISSRDSSPATPVKFQLDQPLQSQHYRDLLKKGYTVRETMTYNSQDTNEQNGKYLVTVSQNNNHSTQNEFEAFTNQLNRLIPRYPLFNHLDMDFPRPTQFPWLSLWF